MMAASNDGVHHFAGTLREAHHACSQGLWQISLRLEDDDGRRMYLHMAPGWNEAGAMACSLQMAELDIGQRYHGSATMHRRGERHDYFVGRVTLAADQRHPPAPLRLVANTAGRSAPMGAQE